MTLIPFSESYVILLSSMFGSLLGVIISKIICERILFSKEHYTNHFWVIMFLLGTIFFYMDGIR